MPVVKSVVQRTAAALAVSILTAIHFWPATTYEFLKWWDDGAHLEFNNAYKGLGWTQIQWMFTPFLGQWMPLTWLSWAIDWRLWGLNPVAFHRTNILLHAVGAGLLFLMARRLIRLALPACPEWSVLVGAVFTALAWSLHPMRVESVAWVNERRDVLSGVFYFLTILTYLKAVDWWKSGGCRMEKDLAGKWRFTPLTWERVIRRRWLAVSIGCFALAVLSKALTVVLPVTLLALDWYPLRRRAWLEKAPYILLAGLGAELAFYSVITVGDMDVLAPVQWITIEDRLLITPYSLWFYLTRTIWPGTLSPLYELTFTPHLFQWMYFLSVCGVIAATSRAIRTRRSCPAWTVAWLTYAVAVLPISGLFQNGYQLVADRYSYLSTLPLLVLAGGILAWTLERSRVVVRDLILVGATVVVVALALATTRYLPTFHDGIAFWTRAVRTEPTCIACADFLVHQDKFKHAHTELARVLERHPELQEQRFEIGMLAFMYARGPEGVAHFTEYLRQATERDPGYIARIEVGRQKHLAMARQVLLGSPEANLRRTFEGEAYGLTPASPR